MAARRCMPGHLLRRCRLLSAVRVGHRWQVRVAITARAGEEAVFLWKLSKADHQQSNTSATQGLMEGCWKVESVTRDGSCDFPLPSTPHPRQVSILENK